MPQCFNIIYGGIITFRGLCRGFIKGWAPGKLTGCERDLAINLPGCFHLLFLLSFIRKTKIARVKNTTDLLHKNVMKPLLMIGQVIRMKEKKLCEEAAINLQNPSSSEQICTCTLYLPFHRQRSSFSDHPLWFH